MWNEVNLDNNGLNPGAKRRPAVGSSFERVVNVSDYLSSATSVDRIVSTATFGDLVEFSYPIGYSHWGVYVGDGHVIHFAVADQGHLMSTVRTSLQLMFPVCGDLLLGETMIRRVPLAEVNVPKGVNAAINNDRHTFTPSAPEDMRRRCSALLNRVFQYHLFNFNCEHFATFIRYGKAVCNQIPGRRKNVECLDATLVFKDFVAFKEDAEDLCG